MAYSASPVHYLFYNSLHYRALWLRCLGQRFTPYAKTDWASTLSKVSQNFKQLDNLFPESQTGMKHILDDTPIESFLTNLYETLQAYEHFFFKEVASNSAHPEWKTALEETSMLWGRSLAQEQMKDERMGLSNITSTQQVLLSFQRVLFGGDFLWKPILVRRLAPKELQYELRSCPHRHPVVGRSKDLADLACGLEACVFKGFSQSLLQNLRFKRENRKDYCLDVIEW
jgi:hypothetical protein